MTGNPSFFLSKNDKGVKEYGKQETNACGVAGI